MKLRYRIAAGLLVVIVAGLGALAVVLSYHSACEPVPGAAAGAETGRAVRYSCYGDADVLQFVSLEKPVPAGNEILVRVRAASVNPLDWHYMRGSPYFMRLMSGIGKPADQRLGVDFAGVVEAVGPQATRFRAGDEVFGGRTGAFAEYLLLPEDRAVVEKPPGVSFAEAASVPIAALTALQALRDKGGLEAGDEVLINGASGGVGTFAVQIAKTFGANVSGVCSTRNVEMVRSIGADHVFDYTREDYTESGRQFDLIVDMVGNHSPRRNSRVLKPGGRLVLVGGPKGNWLAPFLRPLQAMVVSPFVEQDLGMLLATLSKDDLATVGELIAAGKVTPVIDRTYTLEELPEAIRYSESGRARGKIIIDID